MKSREVTGSCVAMLAVAGLVVLDSGAMAAAGQAASAREAGGPAASRSPAPSIPATLHFACLLTMLSTARRQSGPANVTSTFRSLLSPG